MCLLKFLMVITIFFVFVEYVNCKPHYDLSRLKRTSDQRLAELETLFALSKMNGKLVTVPIGFGKIDPNKLGRRRRSIDFLLQQIISDLSGEETLNDEIYGIIEPKVYGVLPEEKYEEQNFHNFFFNDELELLSHPHQPVKLPD